MVYDIVMVTGEPFADHPFSGMGILKRVLEDKGFSVGIIECPDWKDEKSVMKLGKPRLFFGVGSGCIDSMLVNYTPMKKLRNDDKFSRMSYEMPDRAVIVYCNLIRRAYKDSKIVIGGVESSLRRFTHYDYWENRLRKSILLDSRADILVFGYGELQAIEIAKRLSRSESLSGIPGTAVVSTEVPENFALLPSYDEVVSDVKAFCRMHVMIDPQKRVAQKFDNRYVLQFEAMQYTPDDVDYVYSLPYSRKIPASYPELQPMEFSILTHRGCFGGCNFCSITTNMGKQVISRSKSSILNEIKRISQLPRFEGKIELSGASANMYKMDCALSTTCKARCMTCTRNDRSHLPMIDLLHAARKMPGVHKVIIKSGVRYDLAIQSPEYIEEIVKYHVDGKLMIAPEHVDGNVLKLMNKETKYDVDQFISLFEKISRFVKHSTELSYYLMVAHPGCTVDNSHELNKFVAHHSNANFVQVFTPTPMTTSTCMYYTGLDPITMKKIYVPYTYNEKKLQKNIALGVESSRRDTPEPRGENAF
jgi:uncharacterized radical SAM protein YgiQ